MASTSNLLHGSAQRKYDRVVAALAAARLPEGLTRSNKSRRIGTVRLGLHWRVIVDCETFRVLDVCSHSRYNRTLDHWAGLLPS